MFMGRLIIQVCGSALYLHIAAKCAGAEAAPQQQEVGVGAREVGDLAVHHKVRALRRDKGRGRLLCCRRKAGAGRSRGAWYCLLGLQAVHAGR